MKNIFISHAKNDKSISKKLVSKLESSGIPCYVSSRDKAAGNTSGLIENSSIFIFILSKSSQQSTEVINQLKIAVNNNCNIIPFKVGDIDDNLGMQYILHSLEWVDAHGDGFDEAFEILLEIIEELSEGRIIKPKKQVNKGQTEGNDFNIKKTHLYAIISILAAILIYLTVFDSETNKSDNISQNNNNLIQNNNTTPVFVNSDLKDDEKIIVGSWRMIDYEDSRTMTPEEKKITEQNIEAMKKQVLLTYNADRTFARVGFTPEIQKGYWEYDSKKRIIYLIPENVNQKEKINIFNLTETEMTIVVTELVKDAQGRDETVTTKITFQKQ
ncbi:MAG: toll/interleukin-1 receptor domain-containing protein [Bacteroidales bacterium]|nr:toll/interleukin-1 receptor domain-containing protein [Bacteroidales bacterium]